MPKLFVISDTHGLHHQIQFEPCDILIIAGDYSHKNDQDELLDFFNWIRSNHSGEVVLISGNHDRFQWKSPIIFQSLLDKFNIRYLEHSSCNLNGILIWGSPVTPPILTGLNRRFELLEDRRKLIWDTIPVNTDIVITHCPPYGILDAVEGFHLGCSLLLDSIYKVKPKYHIFGHIHESFGYDEKDGIQFINAAIVHDGLHGRMCNRPFLINF
jgi:Icc-related predicted phosphoesterase